MNNAYQTGGINIQDLKGPIENSINTLESQLMDVLNTLNSNPTPSQKDLLSIQTMLQLWTASIQMESSIVKVYGDTMKQLVNNMGQ